MAISKVILNGVTQMDITDTTATAEDVANGKVFYGADGVRTVGTSSGGGGEPLSRSDVNFYDYDGTLLHSYTVAQINDSGFSMPSNPSPSGLTAQGWNWTLEDIRTQLAAMPTQPVDVWQVYITDDGKTRLYCRFEEGRLHPYLGLGVNGTVVVDWGDGSAISTLTGTSLTETQVADHVYASSGDYMITLTVSSGSARIQGDFHTTYLLRKANDTTDYIHRVYSNALIKVELGTNIDIGDYAFGYCYSLANITIPSGVTSIGAYAFQYCYSLANITIPSGVTSIGSYAFQYCYSLANITIPSGVTSIGSRTFQTCYSLANITIPNGVTSIGTAVFGSDYGLGAIHFKPTTPPTVTNSNAWAGIPTDCKIYVPTGTLSAYTSASNYPSSSTYTYIEE